MILTYVNKHAMIEDVIQGVTVRFIRYRRGYTWLSPALKCIEIYPVRTLRGGDAFQRVA